MLKLGDWVLVVQEREGSDIINGNLVKLVYKSEIWKNCWIVQFHDSFLNEDRFNPISKTETVPAPRF